MNTRSSNRNLKHNLVERSAENILIDSAEDAHIPTLQEESRDLSQDLEEDLLGFSTTQDRANLSMESQGNNNGSPAGTDENLLARVRETIFSNQEEMRLEMNSLKATLETLTNTLNTANVPHAVTQRTFSPSLPVEKFKLDKWKLNFDGNGKVSDFLFKIDTLASRTGCPEEHLLANFQIFLSGKAEDWYWNFVKQNENPSYDFLSYAISQEFGTVESDEDLLLALHKRKQQPKESYDNFHSALVSINVQMKEPLPDHKLIKILKKNAHANLRIMLFNTDPRSLYSLRNLARDAEKVLADNKSDSKPLRCVNEIDAELAEDESELDIDPQLCALNLNRRSHKPDFSRIKCWNCQSMEKERDGHRGLSFQNLFPEFLKDQAIPLPQEEEAKSTSSDRTLPNITHSYNLPGPSKPNAKISRCRARHKTRKHFHGSKNAILGHCKLPVKYKGITKFINFYIVPSLTQEAYLGIDFWREFAIAPNIVPAIETLDINSVDARELHFHTLSAEQKVKLDKVVAEFPSFEKLGLGCTSLVEHHIDTGDAPPIKCKHYPLSPRQAEVFQELDRLLEMGVIEESNSPWCFPIVNVRKPGKVRLCLDSRKLNAITKKDSYPLPHINGLLSRLKDTHFISGIDLKDAFFQIRLTESSKEKTAFAVPGRPLYHYRVMPFGLCNGPQAMSRLMDKTIPSRLRENVFVYLDDLLVCSATFEEHIELLSQVAKCLKNAGLTINVDKSKFCQSEIKYLGYRIGRGCLKVDPDKVAAIVDFPVPKSPRQVRRFIGMANWYRSFINNFASMAGPLTNCLSKRQGTFSLTPEAIESFENIKLALSSAPVLAQPDFSKEFVIQCDASRIGVGGVLFQVDDENRERPISFVSQKLNRAQRNYTVTELECLAAVVCVKRFRPYIEGSHFRIITDHSSLKWLMTQKDLSGRLARWSLKLQGFDFRMEHRKGTQNIVPDALSRFDIDSVEVSQNFEEIELDSEEFNSSEYNELKNIVSNSKTQLPDVCVIDNRIQKSSVSARHGKRRSKSLAIMASPFCTRKGY
ncbi:Retrovirus-related Pol polyprotein from transposon 297 [Eumeta japonica]|uniref:RNA-directed DNA polymerase n=1 Tax=Eumeta variegata TaxID=151549 RepID=A0A4C2AEH1_EUMVA|nr:Retrovirus-related Pol polyprotein from transposon 297 [Eumeta japonica]